MRRFVQLLFIVTTVGLTGCDLLGIESASQLAARREAEGKAIGAGCRHAARSVEACYALNKRADKAAVFTGWKEMNEYMAENKIEAVPPPPETTAVASAEEAVEEPEPKKAAKGDAKKAGTH